MIENLRNIAIIAHVDHGKTTLVDKMLEQSGTLGDRANVSERMMDSNAIEQERGITILAKNTAIKWNDYRINIVDTPGHADFGGEVERVLSMVDSVLLLVDAVDGPMPQTRFVTSKAFAMGFKPIVVINKIDRPGARPDWALDQTFELFDKLGATDEQLDFPVVYASAINGYAGMEDTVDSGDMTPLFQTIVDSVNHPDVDPDAPFQMQVSQLDYNSYTGLIGIGRIKQGKIKKNSAVKVIDAEGKIRNGRILQPMGFHGLDRIDVDHAQAGDIIAFTGMDKLHISDTLCDPDNVVALPAMTVDEPTVSMTFQVNNSPFAGKEGKYVTSRNIQERLDEELLHNVALRVEPGDDIDKFRVSGRGELHLGILIENMRREGFEVAVSRPEVVVRGEGDSREEPYENLTIDIEENHQGSIMEKMGERKGALQNMETDGKGRIRLEYVIPSRGLIGFQTEFMTLTSGTGLMYHSFDHYGPFIKEEIGQRSSGVLVSNATGKALAFAIFNLQERGKMFIDHAQEVYEGQVVGIHSRDNDLVVNPLKAKQLNNIRAAGTDENLILVKPIKFTLEQALEFVDDDELVEITPDSIRIRKKILNESLRKAATRSSK
ncbi:translational GTPase TypA [Cocleimonas flava]|uniref:Large ribosomal subunit assembly factor BipA n=1 Tax=Cocleimonas flava TaxID=634765 RepID=A0A4R1FAQ4_9GAMM|nr:MULTISPECIES: translational GTPase TypA [Cocleimonas]MEB8431326.1 translational GTPase TypA [Cocleimonas sp. KMM 6892]MEC4713902.1 translational GTPase TypA [Cocleimonas sp. KMM 6895]MEC4743233.1 translational GTPase TypA [Cocleimonas sp. KMM 6896]TCJ89008.1 GTP-binding protein [Cocleimonas flava]